MSAYTEPIQSALIIFAIAAVLLFIPWLIYTYRKYGFLSISKTLIVFSFILYFLSALFLVLLPLPETTNTCAIQKPDTKFYNLQPFKFLDDIKRNTTIDYGDLSSWVQIVKQPAFFQAFFNLLLLLPLGVYIRYYFKQRKYWLRAFLIGLVLSAFYEVTQVTGIYGIYNCPYRIFDVDDLMLNSLGTLIGFLLAPILLAMLPRHKDVVEHAEEVQQKRKIKPLHYLVALIVDFALVTLITNLAAKQYSIAQSLVTIALYILFFIFVPFLFKGQTLGMKLLRVRLVNEGKNTVSKMSIIKRALAIISITVLFAILRLINQIELNMDSSFYTFQIMITLVSFICVVLLMLLIIWNVIRFLFSKKGRQLFFDDYAEVEAIRKKQ